MKSFTVPVHGVRLIELQPHIDDRGVFVEAFQKKNLEMQGIRFDVKMMNLSMSTQAGTVRGMHWQTAPFQQGKIVFSARGRIFDAVVDVRPGSETFGKCYHVELKPQENALYIPSGVAHGCQALEAGAMLTYLLDNYYSPVHEKGLRYDDPDAKIPWPLPPVQVAKKDLEWPTLQELEGGKQKSSPA